MPLALGALRKRGGAGTRGAEGTGPGGGAALVLEAVITGTFGTFLAADRVLRGTLGLSISKLPCQPWIPGSLGTAQWS